MTEKENCSGLIPFSSFKGNKWDAEIRAFVSSAKCPACNREVRLVLRGSGFGPGGVACPWNKQEGVT